MRAQTERVGYLLARHPIFVNHFIDLFCLVQRRPLFLSTYMGACNKKLDVLGVYVLWKHQTLDFREIVFDIACEFSILNLVVKTSQTNGSSISLEDDKLRVYDWFLTQSSRILHFIIQASCALLAPEPLFNLYLVRI